MNKRQLKKWYKKLELIGFFRKDAFREYRRTMRLYREYAIDIERAKKNCRGCKYFKENVCTRDFFKPCVKGE